MERISLEEAQSRLTSAQTRALPTESVALTEALNRVLAKDICATIDQPPYDRSPLDGYALRSADLSKIPVTLPVTQRIYAGNAPEGPLTPGTAARVMTGAPLPGGADCVLRQEDTDGGDFAVTAFARLKHHQNYVFAGEDVKSGQLLAAAGARLSPAHIGVLAAQGMLSVSVRRRARVALLSTGSELIPAGQPLSPGRIYDSNAPLLAARLAQLGAVPHICPAAPDGVEALATVLDGAWRDNDMMITTGGVSVGERDFMPRMADALGARLLFHGVSVRPGGPALALERDGKLLIALSGNPFAAAATFELLARPALEALSGSDWQPQRIPAVLDGDFPKPSPVRRFLRATLRGGTAIIGNSHASGSLLSMIGSNCLIDVPAGSPPLHAGDPVAAWPM